MTGLTKARTPAQTELDLSELRIETVSSQKAFVELQAVWDYLAEAAGLEHPFLEYDWVRTWWETFGKGSRLHILVVKAGDESIAIAPLMLSTVRMWGIKVRRLGFLHNDHVPRADFLIARRPKDVYRAIWTHLSQGDYWDLLQLCQLPEGSETLTELPRLAAKDAITGTWISGSSPYVSLRSSWSDYHADLAPKHRANLRNRFKRLSQTGAVELETVSAGRGLGDAVRAGVQIEAAAWKGEAGTAIACHADIESFYTLLAQRIADRGWLRLHFLKAGPTRIAFDYSIAYKSQLFFLKGGYDPEFARYSPSNLLVCLVLQRAFEQRNTRYDFLGDSADWKSNWADHSTSHYWLFIFSGSLKGRLLHFIKFRAISWMKSLRHRHAGEN